MREDELAALKERFPHRLEWSRKFLEMNELVFSIEAVTTLRSMRPRLPCSMWVSGRRATNMCNT